MTLEEIFAQHLLSIDRNSYLGKFSAGWARECRLLKERLRWDPDLKPAVLLSVQECVQVGARGQRS